MEGSEERMFCSQRQNSLLRHCAIYIVVLDDYVFFQNLPTIFVKSIIALQQLSSVHLHSIDLFGSLQFSQHHFAKTAFAEHLQKIEVVQAKFFLLPAAFSLCVCR
jgi:hypothetical protein